LRYVKAVLLGFAAALLLGVAEGALEAVRALPPEHKATVLALGISCAVNSAVFFTLVFVPTAVLIVYVRARRRRRSQDPGRPAAS
jgi:hypothetical protein